MWVIALPGVRTAPVGIYEDPPPEDAFFLSSYRVGRGGAARLGRTLTRAADDVNDFINGLLPHG
jgi:hypothetical protein